jgi:hypothetical protein
MSYLGTTTATNLYLSQASHSHLAMVLLIEGYNIQFTTSHEVTALGTAWATATQGLNNGFNNLKGGLSIVGAIDRSLTLFSAKIAPSNLTFNILDAGNDLLPLLYGESRRDILRTRLDQNLENGATTVYAKDVTKIPDLNSLYLGHELMDPSAESTLLDTWTVTRGLNSLHRTEDGTEFSRYHEVDPDGGANPEITSHPTKWINRGVSLFLCHKVGGTWSAGFPGTVTNDAELLWSGRIKHYSEDGQGNVSLDCTEILEMLQSSIGTRLYEGTLQEGGYVGEEEQLLVLAVERGNTGTGAWSAYTQGVINMTAVGGEHVTHQEIAHSINNVLGAFLATAAGTYGPSTARLNLTLRDGRYAFEWTDNSPTGYSYRVHVYLYGALWEMLGWRDANGRSLFGNYGSLKIIEGLVTSSTTRYGVTAPEAPLRTRTPTNSTINSAPIVVENAGHFPYVPQTRMPANLNIGDADGFLLIDDKIILAVKQNSTDNFTFRGNFPFLDGEDERGNHLSFTTASDDQSGKLVKISQIWIEPGTIGETMLRLMVSTGTEGYNHETYDVLPRGLGLGIPWSLIDSLSWLAMGDDPYLLVISKSTSAAKLIESALNLTGRHATWKDGAISCVLPVEPGSNASELIELTEANKATEIVKDGKALVPFADRVTVTASPESIINRITLRYHADLGGEFARTVNVVGVQSQSDYDEVRSVVIDALGIYDSSSGSPEPQAGAAATWQRNVAAGALAYFGKPLMVFERSYNLNLAAELYPGAKVSLDDLGIIDPTTGERGVEGLLAWVLSAKYDWLTGVGKCQCVFSPSAVTTSGQTKTSIWAPSGRVDEDYSGSGIDSDTIATYKFNELSVSSSYDTAVDAAVGGRDLFELGNVDTGPGKMYSHIVNGPEGRHYARWFPGPDGTDTVYLACTGDSDSLDVFTDGNGYTVECWVRLAEIVSGSVKNNIYIYYEGPDNSVDPDGNRQFQLYINSSGLPVARFATSTNVQHESACTGDALEVDTWYHLAVTVDNSGATLTIKFYVNGVLRNTNTGVTKPTGGADADHVVGGTLHGTIDDLRISNTVRTPGEIQTSYESDEHELDGSTFALWRFDEEPDAFEESEYGYHLRLVDGSIDIEDPLAPDSGKSRDMGAGPSYYIGHYGYTPMVECFQGDWTVEAWTKMNPGWNV